MKKLSDATEYNGVIYTAGQVAENLNAGMKAQTADVLRQIDCTACAMRQQQVAHTVRHGVCHRYGAEAGNG
jgi:enamine deaminase RidA (YjgF/YER057c/UK114 family)